jgi:PAS domain S-box-containing protein
MKFRSYLYFLLSSAVIGATLISFVIYFLPSNVFGLGSQAKLFRLFFQIGGVFLAAFGFLIFLSKHLKRRIIEPLELFISSLNKSVDVPRESEFSGPDTGELDSLVTAVRTFAGGRYRSYEKRTEILENEVRKRIEIEEALRKSEKRFRSVVEHQTEFIVRWLMPKGTLTFVNDSFCRYFDLTREEAIGNSFFTLVEPGDLQDLLEECQRLTPENSVMDYDKRVILADGTKGWNHWTDQALFNDQGKLVEIQSVGRDITQRKKSQQEIELLQQIARRLTGKLRVSSLVGTISKQCCHAFDYHQMALGLFDHSQRRLSGMYSILVKNSVSEPEFQCFKNNPDCISTTLLDQIQEEGIRAAVINRPDPLPPFLSTPLRDSSWGSVIYAWIVSEGKCLGILFFLSLENNVFQSGSLSLIQSVADQCCAALARVKAEEERNIAQAHEQKMRETFTRQLIESQELERNRIAKELHDSLGQNLLLIRNYSQLSLGRSAKDSKMDSYLEEVSKLASSTVEEIRSISHSLSPYQLDQLGLTEALESMIDTIGKSSGIGFHQDIDMVDDLFSAEAAANIFRVVQEGLNNIVKHSQSPEANVSLKLRDSELVLAIKDEGIGFDTSIRSTAGIGLMSLSERAGILRGTLTIDSRLGKGTRIELRIPITG